MLLGPLRVEGPRFSLSRNRNTMARLWVSEHAASRFKERHCPGFTLSHAYRELRAISSQAIRTDERRRTGEEVWKAGTNGEVILIVRMNRTHGQMPTIVTVLDARELELDDLGMEAAE